jgi:hypothetical protein
MCFSVSKSVQAFSTARTRHITLQVIKDTAINKEQVIRTLKKEHKPLHKRCNVSRKAQKMKKKRDNTVTNKQSLLFTN